MLLDIQTEVFDGPDHQPVIQILTLVAKDRHEWRPSPAAAVRATSFVAGLDKASLKLPVLKLWAQKEAEAAADRGQPREAAPGAVRPVVRVTPDTVAAMAEDLSRPAVLVVENRIGDGGFVRAVAAALQDERVVLALRKRWLKFCHAGGTGQMAELAVDECGDFRLVVRVAMLIDSDRNSPGQPSVNQRKVERARAGGVAHIHMFTWRMVENYVPYRVWEGHFAATKANKVKELRGWPPTTRGYRHLKTHFVGDRKMPSPLMPERMRLTEADFDELGPGVVAELRQVLAMIHQVL